MAGLYIHIPFCRHKCHYCNFHFSTSLKSIAGMLSSIKAEIALRSRELHGERIETIYFGGGTPSLIGVNEIEKILTTIRSNYILSKDVEISIEINPEDVTNERVACWKSMGINRASVGVQSFSDSDLLWMNRKHSGEQAIESIKVLKEQGFKKLSIDLIYGIPTSEKSTFRSNIKKAIDLEVGHISAYMLTVEPNTALAHLIQKNKCKEMDEELVLEQFVYLKRELEAEGFEQYELSSFAKADHRSRHNTSYWQFIPYLGFGPSAHSFTPGEPAIRRWNVSSNSAYIKGIESGLDYFEEEKLEARDIYNEYIMTSLRTWQGIDLSFVKARFDKSYVDYLVSSLNRAIKKEQIVFKNNHYHLHRNALMKADSVIADLFVV